MTNIASDFHYYVPAEGHRLPHDPFNAIVGPRPIGWISSQATDGTLNLAPYSFFNAFNYIPPIVGFASIGTKDTLANVQDTGEFGWSLATRELAEAMNASCAPVAADVDEFMLAGVAPAASRKIRVPRVAQSPVSFECKVTQILQLRGADGGEVETWLVLGEVVGVYIATDLLHEGIYQTAKARPVLRGGGPADFFELGELFKMFRPLGGA